MKRNQILTGIGAAMTAVGIAIAVQANPNRRMFNPLQQKYSDLVPSLQQQTDLPLRLPSFVPISGGWQPGDSIPYYFNVADSNASSYSIYLDLREKCYGATACNKGEVRAKRIASTTPALNQDRWLDTYDQADLKTVALPQGVQGIFAPSVCHAYCNQARIVFDLDGVRYFIGLKAGKRKQLENIADSIIANPITPQDYE